VRQQEFSRTCYRYSARLVVEHTTCFTIETVLEDLDVEIRNRKEVSACTRNCLPTMLRTRLRPCASDSWRPSWSFRRRSKRQPSPNSGRCLPSLSNQARAETLRYDDLVQPEEDETGCKGMGPVRNI